MILRGLVLSGEVMKEIASSSKTKSKIELKKKHAFDAQAFLDSAGLARMVGKFRGKETVLGQGDPAKDVLYIQEGGVKLPWSMRPAKKPLWRWTRRFFWGRVPSGLVRLHGHCDHHCTYHRACH
jgi:hypothetical protein